MPYSYLQPSAPQAAPELSMDLPDWLKQYLGGSALRLQTTQPLPGQQADPNADIRSRIGFLNEVANSMSGPGVMRGVPTNKWWQHLIENIPFVASFYRSPREKALTQNEDRYTMERQEGDLRRGRIQDALSLTGEARSLSEEDRRASEEDRRAAAFPLEQETRSLAVDASKAATKARKENEERLRNLADYAAGAMRPESAEQADILSRLLGGTGQVPLAPGQEDQPGFIGPGRPRGLRQPEVIDEAMDLAGLRPKPEELSPGASLINPRTGEIIGTAPGRAGAEPDVLSQDEIDRYTAAGGRITTEGGRQDSNFSDWAKLPRERRERHLQALEATKRRSENLEEPKKKAQKKDYLKSVRRLRTQMFGNRQALTDAEKKRLEEEVYRDLVSKGFAVE